MPPITPQQGGPKFARHNFYSAKDFYYPSDPENGILRTYDGSRVANVSEDFIVGLQAGMEEEVGDAAGLILYKTGYEWGIEDMRTFEARMGPEFGGNALNEMNINFVLETWWWPLTAEGWGTWGFDFSYRKQGLIFVDLYDSAVAKSLERVGKPVCYVYAGMFAAMFTYLSKKELSSIEIQCYANGEDYCKFLVGLDARVNAAKFWMQEGAKASDVMQKLAL